jgi:TolA-binding protein
MTWWPGWDSIESSSSWANFYFWFGIACLVALAASEVISHVYSLHKDELVAVAGRVADTKRQQDQQQADASHAAELGGLKGQLTEAEKKVADLQKVQPQRRLTQPQKDALFAAMNPFPGQKISIDCIMGDIYGKEVAQDFVEIARKAKWDDGGGTGFSQSVYTQDPAGILVFINNVEADAHRATSGITALVQTLANLSLIPSPAVTGNTNVTAGAVKIVIGKKP